MRGKHAPGTLLLASSPCPFCGVHPISQASTASSGVRGWLVMCRSEFRDCRVHPQVWMPTKEEAIAEWCRRSA